MTVARLRPPQQGYILEKDAFVISYVGPAVLIGKRTHEPRGSEAPVGCRRLKGWWGRLQGCRVLARAPTPENLKWRLQIFFAFFLPHRTFSPTRMDAHR